MNRTAFRLTQALTFTLALITGGLPSAPAFSADPKADGIQRSEAGPNVVITAGKDRTVYEYRQNGQLRMVKIVPKFGRPYYLVPADQTRGFGDLGQGQMLLPQWVIVEF